MNDWMIAGQRRHRRLAVELPPICIDCGQRSSNNARFETTLYWYPTWIWVGILFGVFPAVLLYFAARRPLHIRYCLCEQHVRWRRAQKRVAYAAWVIFVALMVACVTTRMNPPLLVAAVVMLVVAAVLYMMAWLPLRVAGHEDGVFGVRGFGKEFLEQAAQRPGALRGYNIPASGHVCFGG